MSDRNGRHFATARGLGLLVLAALLFAGSAWIWNLGASRIALTQRSYPVPASHCENAKTCDQKALVDGRTAYTADTALYIALGQLVASIMGLGGVGYTVFYARQAWKEAERSANAAQEALDDTRTETAEQATRFETQLKVAADAAVASAKGAEAMERVADAMAQSVENVKSNMQLFERMGKRQTRAYLTIQIGTAAYQERDKNIQFASRPIILNTGATPAHNVRFRFANDVLPCPIPDDFKFVLPDDYSGGNVINSQQTLVIGKPIGHYIDKDDVFPVMAGVDRALFVWGDVIYDDIFGDPHITRFAFYVTWVPNSPVLGSYHQKHNDAD